MKKFLSLVLASLTYVSMFAVFAPRSDQLDPAITVASSDAYANAEWLDARLDNVPDNVIVGIGSNETYGIDMSDFESDGYILREMDGQVLAFGATADGLDRAVRKYAKSVEKGISENLDEVYHEGKRIKKLTIDGKDISEYTIVYEYDTDFVSSGFVMKGGAQFAADELARLIEVATGIRLSVEKTDVEGPVFEITYLNDGEHGENGFTYEVKDGNVCISGSPRGNGCANGVYYFLEHECGWKNLLYGDSMLAESEHVEVPEGANADIDPMFGMYLQPWYRIKYESFTNDRDAVSQNYLGVKSITSHGVNNWCEFHTGNPCFTDEIIIEEACTNIVNYLTNSVNAGKTIGYDLVQIHLGQMDTDWFCLCQVCKKVYNEEGRTHAGAYVRWVNAIAQAAEDAEYGGVYYNIYGYWGTQKPPAKTVPHKDVSVSFCTDGHCFVHGLDSGECCRLAYGGYDLESHSQERHTNQQYAEWIRSWGEISENFFVWYYALDNNLNAFSSINTMYEDLKFLQECGVEGLFWQCDWEGLGIALVQYALIVDMQWNPDMTEEEFEVALCETLEDEYGEGWYYIREYLNIWHEAQLRSGYCKTCWGYNLLYTTGNYDWDYYAERYDEMYGLFEKALALADCAAQEKAIELLSAHMIAEGSVSSYFTAYEAGDEERLDVLRDRYAIMVERMLKYGVDPAHLKGQDNWGHRYAYTLDDQAWNGWYHYITMYGMDDAERLPDEIPEEFRDAEADNT